MKISDEVEDRSGGAGESRDPRPGAGAAARDGAGPSASGESSKLEVAEALWRHFNEFRAYAESLVRVEKARAKLAMREKLADVGREVAIGATVAVLALVGAAYLLVGLTGALSDLFSEQPWIGKLLLGGALLLGALVFAGTRGRKKKREELSRKVAEYEQRRAEHRSRFERYVSDRPGGAPGTGERERSAGA
jgi:hypothetical protein